MLTSEAVGPCCSGLSLQPRPIHRSMVPGGQACPHAQTRFQGPEGQGSPQADTFFLSALHPPRRFHPQPGGKKAAAASVITSAPRDLGGLSPTRTPSWEVGKAPNPLIPHVPPPTPRRGLGNTVPMDETSRRSHVVCDPEQGHLQRQKAGDTRATLGRDTGHAAPRWAPPPPSLLTHYSPGVSCSFSAAGGPGLVACTAPGRGSPGRCWASTLQVICMRVVASVVSDSLRLHGL